MTTPAHPWQVIVRCACCGLRVLVDAEIIPEPLPRPQLARASAWELDAVTPLMTDRDRPLIFATSHARRLCLLVRVSELCPRCHPPPKTTRLAKPGD